MRRGERIGFRAKFAARINSPVIRLLFRRKFRCYSAAIPLLIPLLIPRSRVGNSPKYLNQRTFSRRFWQETAAWHFFSPITGESGFPADPDLCTASRREPAVGRGACSKNT